MDIKEFFNESEKPLEHLVSDGGFTKIFRTIGCIGDSLSSGEFETCDKDGKKGYHDMYEYSWGQFIARTCGSTVYNFSRGGLTGEFFMGGAPQWGWYDYAKRAQAYIFALGVNDLYGKKFPVGTPDDHVEDKTFAGWYIEIIRRYKEIQPQAKFFLMTMVHTGDKDTDAAFVREAAAHGLVNLKGHRLVGGIRASIYNAMPIEGVRRLVDFMKEFEAHAQN